MSAGIAHLLQNRVPDVALTYCVQLWADSPFHFKLRKARQTKVGDFSCRPGATPQITVNEDLHPFVFLITYIHEVAHLHVHQTHGNRAEAHGSEWKKRFQLLMEPVLHEGVFPPRLLEGLRVHLADPMASTFSDPVITRLLRSYDPRTSQLTLLSEIPEGSIFSLNGRWFRKGKIRRTRVVCKDMHSRRSYLVPVDAPVQNVQLSLL
ncbi:MAG: SprT-like domain-containing protein [Bacteroidota bacterium]